MLLSFLSPSMSKGWCENQEFVDTLHFCAFKKVISSKQLKLSARFEGKNTEFTCWHVYTEVPMTYLNRSLSLKLKKIGQAWWYRFRCQFEGGNCNQLHRSNHLGKCFILPQFDAIT